MGSAPQESCEEESLQGLMPSFWQLRNPLNTGLTDTIPGTASSLVFFHIVHRACLIVQSLFWIQDDVTPISKWISVTGAQNTIWTCPLEGCISTHWKALSSYTYHHIYESTWIYFWDIWDDFKNITHIFSILGKANKRMNNKTQKPYFLVLSEDKMYL